MSETTFSRMVFLGTGTDVGKTYVATAVARAWKEQQGSCLALKPVESGVADIAHDAEALRAAGTWGAAPRYSFTEPVSPHLAARDSAVNIEADEVAAFVQHQEAQFAAAAAAAAGKPLSLVESAGGVFSPISAEKSNFDLALALDPALWVLVCPDALGVLHDVAACLHAMKTRLPDVLVLCEARPRDASTGKNAAEIRSVTLPQVCSRSPELLPLLGSDFPILSVGKEQSADHLISDLATALSRKLSPR